MSRPGAGTTAVAAALAAIIGVLASRSLGLATLGVAFFVLLVAVVVRERPLILVLVTTAVVFGSSVFPEVSDSLFLARFVGYAALIGVAVLSSKPTWTGPDRSLLACLTLFVAVALGSVAWSIDPSLTAQRGLSVGLLFGVVLASSGCSWVGRSELRKDLSVLFVVGSGVLALCLPTYLLRPEWAFSGERFRGLLENPNSIGVLVALTLPVGAGLLASARRKGIWVGLLAVQLVALLLSQSRGGIVAAAVGVAVFGLMGSPIRRRRFLVAIIGGGAIVLAAFTIAPQLKPSALTAVEARFRNEPRNSQEGSGRVTAWRLAWSIYTERPVAGWGFGTTEETFGVRSVEIEQVFKGLHPHNVFLEVLLEVGPAGLAFLLGAIAVALRAVLVSVQDPLVSGVKGAVVAGVTFSMIESGMTAAGSIFAFFFWFMVAGVVRLAHQSSQPAASAVVRRPEDPSPSRDPLSSTA